MDENNFSLTENSDNEATGWRLNIYLMKDNVK